MHAPQGVEPQRSPIFVFPYTYTLCRRTTKLDGMADRLKHGEGLVLGGQPRLRPKGRSPSAPQFFGFSSIDHPLKKNGQIERGVPHIERERGLF